MTRVIWKRFLIFFVPFVALVACASIFGVRHVFYEYESAFVETSGGSFNLTFNPDPYDEMKNGKPVVVWKGPYYFNTQYIKTAGKFERGEISNLYIANAETGEFIYKEDFQLDVDSTRDGHGGYEKNGIVLAGFGAGPFDISHENYRVSFDYNIVLDNGDSYDSGSVDTVVKTKYYERRH